MNLSMKLGSLYPFNKLCSSKKPVRTYVVIQRCSMCFFKIYFASKALRKASLNQGAGFISCHCFATEMNEVADCCSSPELLLHPDLNVFCHFMLTLDPDRSQTEN